MTNTEKEIIERIKDQMKTKGYTQKRLASCLGLQQYNISRMFEGKPFPSINQLLIIAANLDCSIQYLLGLKEESYTELSKESGAVAHAYINAGETIKSVVKRILEIDVN